MLSQLGSLSTYNREPMIHIPSNPELSPEIPMPYNSAPHVLYQLFAEYITGKE